MLEWDDYKNSGLKLSNFIKGSHDKVHWKCAQFDHKWITEIKVRCLFIINVKDLKKVEERRETDKIESTKKKYATLHKIKVLCNKE